MTSQIINGIVFDTDSATLVETINQVVYSPDHKKFLPSGDREWDRYCELYIGLNGAWFVVERATRLRLFGLLGRDEGQSKVLPVSADIAFNLLQQVNAIGACRKWFPDRVANA
jgi:hypothetical protein